MFICSFISINDDTQGAEKVSDLAKMLIQQIIKAKIKQKLINDI